MMLTIRAMMLTIRCQSDKLCSAPSAWPLNHGMELQATTIFLICWTCVFVGVLGCRSLGTGRVGPLVSLASPTQLDHEGHQMWIQINAAARRAPMILPASDAHDCIRSNGPVQRLRLLHDQMRGELDGSDAGETPDDNT